MPRKVLICRTSACVSQRVPDIGRMVCQRQPAARPLPPIRRRARLWAALVALTVMPQLALADAPAPRLDFTADEMQLALAVSGDAGLAAWYGKTGLAPLFTAPDGARLRSALVHAMGTARSHGLPDVYDAAALAAMDGQTGPAAEAAFARGFSRWTHDVGGGILTPRSVDPGIRRDVPRVATETLLARFAAADDPAAMLDTVPPQSRDYRRLREALAAEIGPGVGADVPLVPEGNWREGMQDRGVSALRTRLAAMGFAADSAVPDLFDAPLAEQVAGFQRRVGLRPDGIAGPRTVARLNGRGAGSRGLLIALERMRWMGTHDLDARMVWVNLPEFTAEVREDGHTVFETRAVIGKSDPEMRTPEFSDEMEHVVVNPRWNVPRSITVKEYLPRLQKNRNAVAHLDIVDGRGRVVARDGIDFGRYTAATFPYRMRQKPSEDNALGEVKFIFPNSMNIYLHDTPSKGLFGESRRAFSHGCVRIGRPVDLAHVLLQGSAADPAARYARARASGKETYLELKPHLPVHLVYFTTVVDEDGSIRHFGDVYGRDAAVWAALQKAGAAAGLETAALTD